MIEPLRLTFVVSCPAAHAFQTWTSRTSSWWPVEATVSGERGFAVMFEPRVGGRIFERTPAGTEIDWGLITVWEPPHRLCYLWHIAADRRDATDVEIVFRPISEDETAIEIEHGGWDRLGLRGQPWRDANQAGWGGVIPAYSEACARPPTEPWPA